MPKTTTGYLWPKEEYALDVTPTGSSLWKIKRQGVVTDWKSVGSPKKGVRFESSVFRHIADSQPVRVLELPRKQIAPLKRSGFRLLGYPPLSMSHGPHSYLKLNKGCRQRIGGWNNGFVKPCNKLDKRKASKRARRSQDLSNGNAHKRLWGYWEWC